ncbi:MAG TPA: DegT/DnrJ/EryC1/StrS family aminotransferase [Armatimonadetes bacterium]|nr:DegT/DnrJ/EryC1/StrS family aminotransferase [Armatimonadota bacterium]
MDKTQREEILKRVRPRVVWRGEPPLGAWYTEEEIEAAVRAIRDSLDWNVGFTGPEIEEFEEAFAAYVGTKYAVAINGAGTGLDMSMMCLDLEPGDEVISCALNFPGTHLAIIGQGGKLVLCEPDPRTFNLDPEDVERRITPRTRAILATHMNGLSVDMDALLEIAERHPHPKHGPLKVIGDAARACGGTYKGTKIGQKGWMTVFSFHTQKLMCTLGEGGMITTDDPQVAERLRQLRSFGRGVSWGTNYKMTKVQAAVGLVQLRRLDEMNAQRVKRAKQRTELLKEVPELTLPYEPPGYGHTYYLYTILVPREWAGEKRDRLMKILAEERRVGCVVANPPTYKSNRLIREHTAGQEVPRAEEIGARLFCPSLHPLMTEEENEYAAAAIIEAVERVENE